MQLFCQSCQAAFTATTHCPRCGSRLLSPQESFIHSSRGRGAPSDPIPATFTNRLVVGILVAIASAIGLSEIQHSLVLLGGIGTTNGFHSNIEPTTYAGRLVAVLLGGLIAGAGRRQGLAVGAMTGLMAGFLFTAIDVYTLGHVNNWLAVALAAGYPLMGGLAGAVGAWLWPADTELPEPTRVSSRGSSLAQLAAEDAERHIHPPTPWLRIAAGATLAMMAIIASDPIRMALSKYSGGLLNTGGVYRSAWIGLQIGTIGLLLGGLLAGSGSRLGFKHGFFAAILAYGGLLFAAANQPGRTFPAVDGLLITFGLEQGPLLSPRVGVDVFFAIVPLMTIAGGLGSHLLPPLVPKRLRTKRFMRMS